MEGEVHVSLFKTVEIASGKGLKVCIPASSHFSTEKTLWFCLQKRNH